MTVAILDRFPGPLPPYAEWLREAETDLVLFTGRAPSEVAGRGYAEVVCLPDFASSSTVERLVLALAERTTVSAIVATAAADLVRAGALRDALDVPGQGRAEALLFADLVEMRNLLSRNGVPTVPGGPVRRVSDLYWHAHHWGYPLRIRDRRAPGWPSVAVLRDEASVRAFTDGGLSPGLAQVPGLLAEPAVEADRRRVPGVLSTWVDALLTALPHWSFHPYRIEAVRTEDGEHLIDTVRCDVAGVGAGSHRELVWAQAGLAFGGPEVVRWAS